MKTGRLCIFIALLVSACGTYTPDKDPFKSDAEGDNHVTSQGVYETAIVNHVACEIGEGLYEAEKLDLPWLSQWGTTVTQTITVEDQTGLSPGVSAVAPFKNGFYSYPASQGGNVTLAQSFSFNLGGTASANALRTETVEYTFINGTLLNFYRDNYYKRNLHCTDTYKGIMIDGDLKIREFIYDKGQIAHSTNVKVVPPPGVAVNAVPPYNVFTEEITFVASYGGSATPTWHLARLTANASSNLLVSQRTNTNDLIITLGPIKCPVPSAHSLYLDPTAKCPVIGPVTLTDTAMAQHLARVQANAIAVSVTSQTH